ncbi:FAD-binding domain-containing protein [Guyanagaster necrorhizus]|uniref:FAD-binding domain-containing protein n=1 Tax=Guyanagaster necrorhizus TaxID=856835 RepID=A0A9P8AN39_9AGAR|nr:FAD-binding domain-containing protein [Guyanagaster necrorhizus MCA 3950]KAG7440497.1 FAD-binding domain-containing protein [Guyanagaster necrorhizus MCA 3950]
MAKLAFLLKQLCFIVLLLCVSYTRARYCRTVPGDPSFPSGDEWNSLNYSLSGRLVKAVPSAEFCDMHGGCTDAEWTSAVFRANIPGAMNQVNWEQDYESIPPSICERNSTDCGQGDVPLYAILAESVQDVQAGIEFSSTHNLRLAVKASGHDYLGRSTARNSLLISTHMFQNITFVDNFTVSGYDEGSAVTVGSGVPLNTLYKAAKEQGKILVGAVAATVVAAGGYIQGGGHSALSPLLGLASDNVIEFEVVTANSTYLKVNGKQNTDLFWALRGGGAGSWGVVVSATFRTFPTFSATYSLISIAVNDTVAIGSIMASHAKHIFDWDDLYVGQYFYAYENTTANAYMLALTSYFPKTSSDDASTALKPFLDEAKQFGQIVSQLSIEGNINDEVTSVDDAVGFNAVLGSRLIPESVYHDHPDTIGHVYTQLFNAGAVAVLGHLVAGGMVSENGCIDSAVHPAWRTAKTHIVLPNIWEDSTTLSNISLIQNTFKNLQLPILEQIAGSPGAAYSNEADSLEEDFRTTFFGPNYPRLDDIKRRYDPMDLFIVAAGVGSDRWDKDGLCRVD